MTHPLFDRLRTLLAAQNLPEFTDLYLVFGPVYDDEHTRNQLTDVMLVQAGVAVTPEFLTVSTWAYINDKDIDQLRHDAIDRINEGKAEADWAYPRMHRVFNAVHEALGGRRKSAEILHVTKDGIEAELPRLGIDTFMVAEQYEHVLTHDRLRLSGKAERIAAELERRAPGEPLLAALALKFRHIQVDDAHTTATLRAFHRFAKDHGLGLPLPGSALRLLNHHGSNDLIAYDPAQPDGPQVFYTAKPTRTYDYNYRLVPEYTLDASSIGAPEQFTPPRDFHHDLGKAYTETSFRFQQAHLPEDEGLTGPDGTRYFKVLREVSGRYGNGRHLRLGALTPDGHLFTFNADVHEDKLLFREQTATGWTDGQPETAHARIGDEEIDLLTSRGQSHLTLPAATRAEIARMMCRPGVAGRLSAELRLSGTDFIHHRDPYFRVGRYFGQPGLDHVYLSGTLSGYSRDASPAQAVLPRTELQQLARQVRDSGESLQVPGDTSGILLTPVAAAMILNLAPAS